MNLIGRIGEKNFLGKRAQNKKKKGNRQLQSHPHFFAFLHPHSFHPNKKGRGNHTMPSHSTRTVTPTMFLKNILSSKRHRRVILVLLVLFIAAILTFNLYQPRPHWKRRTPLAPYGLDSTEKPITRESNKYRGKTQAVEIEVPASTWKCTDDDLTEDEKKTERNERTRQCFVENLCVDRQG